MSEVEMDRVPRFVPTCVFMPYKKGVVRCGVSSSSFHPAGAHAFQGMRKDIGVLAVHTALGARHYGVEKAYINSTLRMVVVGFPKAFEEMAKWKKVPQNALT